MSSITIRATAVQQVALVIKIGDQFQTLETAPSDRWAVSVDTGQLVEVIAVFDHEEQAVEAAQALESQMRAEMGAEGEGLRLATRNGETLQ